MSKFKRHLDRVIAREEARSGGAEGDEVDNELENTSFIESDDKSSDGVYIEEDEDEEDGADQFDLPMNSISLKGLK